MKLSSASRGETLDGVLGIYSKENCVGELFRGMFCLQDRGQEYCGMSTSDGEEIKIRTHRGEVLPTFSHDLNGMEGYMGIGHTSSSFRQPVKTYYRGGEFTLGFDGYLMNANDLRNELYFTGHAFTTGDDGELLGSLIVQEMEVVAGLKVAMQKIAGPCAIVVLTPEAVYAARPLPGWQPLVLGEGNHCLAVASESCAFNGSGIKIRRDVAPGELVKLDKNGITTLYQQKGRKKICSFTWIYFARPDSIADGVPVARVRHNLGRYLAEEDDIDADVVAPVPMSGIMHAEGYHLASGLPSLGIFLPPRRINRTYIRPIEKRKEDKSRKFIPIDENVRGKRIILVDDSIRAGVTMRGLVAMLRDAGAKEVHVRIGSPVSKKYCPYDRPPSVEEQFIAATYSVEQIREFIGADTLKYQKPERVAEAIGLPEKDLCLDCFK